MIDPLLAAVAAAVGTKTVEGLTEGGKAAFTALVRLVRRKSEEAPVTADALDHAQAEPGDEDRVRRLAEALEQIGKKDPAFLGELRRLWSEVEAGSRGGTGGAVDTVSGSVGGHVVQAQEIHGGIIFGPPARPGD